MTEQELWIPVDATVTSCRYQFRAASALAFGVPLGEKFRITFDYRAHDRLYSDEFQSPDAIPQNTILPLRYNPLHPEQNTLSHNQPTPPPSSPNLFVIGITGSVVLSLLWLAILRGCF
jgi:hypothetical protein